MDNSPEYYFDGEPEHIKKIYIELYKTKPGQHIELSKSKMYREDKETLIDICKTFILFMQKLFNDYSYHLSLYETVFYCEKLKNQTNE